MLDLNFRLTTADGGGVPVRLFSTRTSRTMPTAITQGGIEGTELETESCEVKDRRSSNACRTRIREVLVF